MPTCYSGATALLRRQTALFHNTQGPVSPLRLVGPARLRVTFAALGPAVPVRLRRRHKAPALPAVVETCDSPAVVRPPYVVEASLASVLAAPPVPTQRPYVRARLPP